MLGDSIVEKYRISMDTHLSHGEGFFPVALAADPFFDLIS